MRGYELFRTADVDDGFLVAQVSRARGYFSVTGSIYGSREAYELGNEWAVHSGGCLHEQIAAALPELRPLIALHLTPTNADTDEARAANEWVDAHSDPRVIPADIPSGPEWAHTFSTGLRVVSKLTGTESDRVGGHYAYKVTVTANGHRYTARTQGSANDHNNDVKDARELAFLALRELCDFLYEGAEELASGFGLDPDEDEDDYKTLAVMRRAEQFVDNVRDQLEPLREVLS